MNMERPDVQNTSECSCDSVCTHQPDADGVLADDQRSMHEQSGYVETCGVCLSEALGGGSGRTEGTVVEDDRVGDCIRAP